MSLSSLIQACHGTRLAPLLLIYVKNRTGHGNNKKGIISVTAAGSPHGHIVTAAHGGHEGLQL